MPRRKLFYGFAFLVLLAMWCGGARTAAAERNCCEGDTWLKWSQQTRWAYIQAFTEGYASGYLTGCENGIDQVAARPQEPGFENFPINKCLDKKLDFSKSSDLSRDVTTFYKRYPENRIVFIQEVLELIGQGWSLEEIHKNPPFRPIARTAK
jgi:hypothetical protein